jgi:predicted DNA-binding protein
MKKNKTKQLLLKMTPELMQKINDAFSVYLKKTGVYKTKAEFIRNILETQCDKIGK